LIDSIGGLNAGANLGVGAHSQLWSHIKFGDTLEGCRFKSEKRMIIGTDVWFVGHCIVSPIIASNKSMALVGSVIIKDMEENHVYAGVPAIDITKKIGPQFRKVNISEKKRRLDILLKQFCNIYNMNRTDYIIIDCDDEIKNDDKIYINIKERTYTKKNLKKDIMLMRFFLPEKVKLTPMDKHHK